jgi:hypothetical protein
MTGTIATGTAHDSVVSFNIRLVQIERATRFATSDRTIRATTSLSACMCRANTTPRRRRTPVAICDGLTFPAWISLKCTALSKLAKTLERRLDTLNNAIGFAKGGEAEFLRFCKALGVTRCVQYTRHSGSSSYDDSEFQFSDHQGGARWLRKMTERIGESLPKRDAA